MRKIARSSRFNAHYKRRANKKIRTLFEKRLRIFQKNPYDPSLYTHPLQHNWAGYWSFSLTDDEGVDDYRVLFRKIGRDSYEFVAFGTHDQLYRSWKKE